MRRRTAAMTRRAVSSPASASTVSGKPAPPVRALGVGARHVERLGLAREIVGLHQHGGRRRGGDEGVGIGEEIAARRSPPPRRPFRARLPFRSLAPLPPARERREIVGGKTGGGKPGPGFGRTVDPVVLLEPQHLVGEDVARRRASGAGLPTTVPRSSPITRQRARRLSSAMSADQVLQGKGHVGAVGGGSTARHPELPRRAQDVIDAQRPGMAHVGAENVPVRTIFLGAPARAG